MTWKLLFWSILPHKYSIDYYQLQLITKGTFTNAYDVQYIAKAARQREYLCRRQLKKYELYFYSFKPTT